MRKLSGSWLYVSILLLALSGCKPKSEPVQGSGRTAHLSFTNAVEEVSKAEVDTIKETGRVEADLNLDGLPDLVLMRVVDEDAGEVEVFLRKPAPEPAPEPVGSVAPMVQENPYIRVGTIRCEAGARITGIASRTRGRYTDLIVLVGHPGQPPRMVHYLNDGTGFTEQDWTMSNDERPKPE